MFSVAATKKGQFPMRIEKRAKGKRVTLIANVTGDALGMLKMFRAVLGVGGGARRDNAAKTFVVELQGDQQERVAHMLLENQWVKGLSKDLIPKKTVAVDRSKTTKYLAKTKNDADISRLFEQGYDYLDNIDCTEDIFDYFEVYDVPKCIPPDTPMTIAEIDAALLALGMLPVVGRDVVEREGLTLEEYQRIGLTPGAHLITDGPTVREKINIFRGRQKITSWKNRIRDGHYFQTCDERLEHYENGGARKTEEMGWIFEKAEDGSMVGTFRMEVPWKAPSCTQDSRWKKVMISFSCDVAGYAFRDPYIVLRIKEVDIVGTNPEDKEALKLEKKLREVQKLAQQPALEKLQKEKVDRRRDYFEALVRRKEYEEKIRRKFKMEHGALDRAWHEAESEQQDDLFFERVDRCVIVEEKGRCARGVLGWQTVRIAGRTWKAETSSVFGIEVLRGLVRVGMEAGEQQWAYVGTGQKTHDGQYVEYASAYGAGDVIQCICGPDGIQYTKNGEDAGVAFALPSVGELSGFVCGKENFSVRLLFWEEDVPFSGTVFNPPRLATLCAEHMDLRPGDVVNVLSRDGKGCCFIFTVDEEDGLWIPEYCVSVDESSVGCNDINGDYARETVPRPRDRESAPHCATMPECATMPGKNAVDNTGVQLTATPSASATGSTNAASNSVQTKATASTDAASNSVQTKATSSNASATMHPHAASNAVQTKATSSNASATMQPNAVSNAVQTNATMSHTNASMPTNSTRLPRPTNSTVQVGVTGLSTWLQGLALMQYEPQAVQWCVENGAVDLREIQDEHAAFCDALGMRPIEKRRVRKAVEK